MPWSYPGFPCGSAGKESTCNAGDLGSIPGLERSPGEGKGYPLQYSGLENSMDCIVHGVAKSWTRLSNFHFLLLRLSSSHYREGNGTPLQYSCLENPMDGGTWWAAVHGVAKSRKWLSDFTFTFHSHAFEKEMTTHSSVLAWRIPGAGEPGGLPSMRSHRVGHDWSNLAVAAALTKHSDPEEGPWLVDILFIGKAYLLLWKGILESLISIQRIECQLLSLSQISSWREEGKREVVPWEARTEDQILHLNTEGWNTWDQIPFSSLTSFVTLVKLVYFFDL